MTKHFCDICGKETDQIKTKTICINFDGFYKNNKNFDVCKYCEEGLESAKSQAEVDFVKRSYWWKQNSDTNEEVNYGEFRQVGTCEQGGVMCPKCGYSNNSYTFNGTCQKCGYTKLHN